MSQKSPDWRPRKSDLDPPVAPQRDNCPTVSPWRCDRLLHRIEVRARWTAVVETDDRLAEAVSTRLVPRDVGQIESWGTAIAARDNFDALTRERSKGTTIPHDDKLRKVDPNPVKTVRTR
jgi:hypothetical protein